MIQKHFKIFLGILMATIAFFTVAESSEAYTQIWDKTDFLSQGLFQVITTDLDGDGNSEIFVSAKAYENRELKIYQLNNDLETVWESDNLFEDRSILWLISGKFGTYGQCLIASTYTKFYIYKMNEGKMSLVDELNHNLQPQAYTAGDIDGDGNDELVVSRIGDITSTMYNCYLQVMQLNDYGNWEVLTQTGNLGNIRSITTGDLNEDGCSEILVEEALKVTNGDLHIFSYYDGKLQETYKATQMLRGAAYGMRVKRDDYGVRLVTATSRGAVNFFRWQNNRFVAERDEIIVKGDLVDVELLDINYDGSPEVLLIVYPSKFKVYTP